MPMTAKIIFGLIVSLLGACAAFKQYRDNPQPEPCPITNGNGACADRDYLVGPSHDGRPGYLLGIVEFDDQGDFWNRRQALDLFQRLGDSVADRKAIYVVFVHGWKHNASEADENLGTIKDILGELQQEQYGLLGSTGDRRARRVVGIYLGWRGKSVSAPVIREFSFWDRKSTAQEVGRGAVIEALERIEILWGVNNKLEIDGTSAKTRLVLIGHSFGGAVVYSALAPVLTDRLATGIYRRGQPNAFGDLVVLVNPAFEAQLAAPLFNYAAGEVQEGAAPILAILTSKADGATKNFFRIGRFLSTLFDKHRDREQKRRDLTAIGHYQKYWTHELHPAPVLAGEPRGIEALYDRQQAQMRQFCNAETRIEIGGAVLTRYRESPMRPGSPYLNVSVDPQIIAHHNDFQNPRLHEFLAALVRLKTAPEFQGCN